MLFSNKTNFPFGLDISDRSLKLIQLKKTGDKIKIQALSKVNLPKGLFDNSEIVNKKEIIKAINNLINNPKFGKVTSKEVIACLPEPKTFIKLIEIQKTEKNLEETVKLEIEKHVPMSIDEIYFDWQVISETSENQKILIGAAPKNIVNQYTDLLDEVKLSIRALEIEPISICRSLLREEAEKIKDNLRKNYGIIDIGARRSNLTVYSKNTILFAFSMPISGNAITAKISETLKIDPKEAEKAKIICGLDEEKAKGIIKDILYGTIKELVSKINDSILFYNHHFPDYGKIDKILLCGGGANIKNLDKVIKDYISIPVEVGNAHINIKEDQNVISKIFSETHKIDTNFSKKDKSKKESKITQDTSITYSTAIGLALRGILIKKI